MDTIIINNQNATVNSDNNRFALKLPHGQRFEDLQICLSSLYLYNSWDNITATFANQSVSYTWHDASSNSITIPAGNYTVSDLSAYIQLQMFENGHYLVDENGDNYFFLRLEENPTYYSVTLTSVVIPTSLPASYTNPASMTFPGTASTTLLVVPSLTSNSTKGFGLLIGFNAGSYPAVSQTSTYQVNSTNIPVIHPVSNVLVRCNLVDNSKFHVQDNLIKTFTANVGVGSQIIIEPNQYTWYNILEGMYDTITVSFFDQEWRELIIKDGTIQIELTIREHKSKLCRNGNH